MPIELTKKLITIKIISFSISLFENVVHLRHFHVTSDTMIVKKMEKV